MLRDASKTIASFIATSALTLCATARAEYTVQRVAGGLNQPVYMTQAPGDPQNLYIVERISATGGPGAIVKLNRATGAKTTFLNFPGNPTDDNSPIVLAFHPDFQTNGLFYLSGIINATNHLNEYKVIGGVPTPQRTLLRYSDPIPGQHTIDWIGFKPDSTGAERNYLYVTTGDGGLQANYENFHNNGQDPTNVMGKLLRIDVNPTAPDFYPANSNKNFAIPANNPFVPDNTGKLKELFQTGFRNPWRASFDRQTGDLYVADVGFNSREEIDFTKNDASFTSGADFGWARREGTIETPEDGVGGPPGTSINPIFELAHPIFDSITGGYVYRGPIQELRGKYFFGDYNTSAIWSLNFDRNTNPANFNGVNGISNVSNMTATINSMIEDGEGPIRWVVSFGEDNAGNIYILGMSSADGTGSVWNPDPGFGEIYMIAPYAADANTDGEVNIVDLRALAENWMQPGDFNHGDFNFDGFVDHDDLGLLVRNWNNPGLSEAMASLEWTSIPEPTTWIGLISFIVLFHRRFRRSNEAKAT